MLRVYRACTDRRCDSAAPAECSGVSEMSPGVRRTRLCYHGLSQDLVDANSSRRFCACLLAARNPSLLRRQAEAALGVIHCSNRHDHRSGSGTLYRDASHERNSRFRDILFKRKIQHPKRARARLSRADTGYASP